MFSAGDAACVREGIFSRRFRCERLSELTNSIISSTAGDGEGRVEATGCVLGADAGGVLCFCRAFFLRAVADDLRAGVMVE